MQQLILPTDIVTQSNEISRAKFTTESIYDARIVAHVAAQICADDTDFKMYEIPLNKLIQSADGKACRDLIRSAAHALMKRVICIDNKNGGWSMYNVFSKIEYDATKEVIRARFDPDLKPHYLQLKQHFTQFKLLEFLLLPSRYSQKIFEFLHSWKSNNGTVIQLEKLHEMLDTPPSFRKDFKAFRTKVLERAKKDILQHTELNFEWKAQKRGRGGKVVAIEFTIATKQKEEKKTVTKKMKREIEQCIATQRMHGNSACADDRCNTLARCAHCEMRTQTTENNNDNTNK